MYILYLLYKSNLISRDNLKIILRVIQEKTEDDYVTYLVKEGKK